MNHPTVVACGAGALAVLAGAVLAGPAGLAVSGTAVAAGALLAARFRLGAVERDRRHRRPPEWALGPFVDYRRIDDALMWSAQSARLYDRGTRPTLQRIAAAVLAERHRVDLERDAPRAAELIGPHLWPLVDPHRPIRDDGGEPGVPVELVARLTDRLEAL